MRFIFILFVFTAVHVSAQQSLPISTQSIQLQELIEKSETQIESLKEILKQSKHDTASLEKINGILNKLSAGIDTSLEKYRGTDAYQKAMLELQSNNDFQKVYSDPKDLRESSGHPALEESSEQFDKIMSFQKESVRANQGDLENQTQLETALQKAEAGFVPKLHAQAQLGEWKTNTRLSAQMTELLGAIHAIREELRLARLKSERPELLESLLKGSEIQNQKLQEAKNR